jgi:hypothetical protein
MNISTCILTASLLTAPLYGDEQPFVIGRLLGQLGNQMFEVATASAVAWDNGAEAYFPDFLPHTASYQHMFYNFKTEDPGEASFRYGTSPFGYHPIPYQPNMEIQGYCQNEQYFMHHRDKLVKLFAPRPKDLKYIQTKYGNLLSRANTVSVHVRYYYAEKPDEASFIQYDRKYYEQAMALFPKDSVFIVTSDNLEFARKNIPADGYEVHFIENEAFYIDFFIQSLCKHHIIANSTFSWWSAWLNENPGKIVVRPEIWLGGYPDIGGPDSWIKIHAEGMERG